MFNQYRKARCSAVYVNVPMLYLDLFRSMYPGKYKIRYRGPRNTPSDCLRSPLNRQSTCLKENAKTFSAYMY